MFLKSVMLRLAIIFFVVAVVSGALGFWGLENTSAEVAKILFVGFIVLAVVSLLVGRRAV